MVMSMLQVGHMFITFVPQHNAKCQQSMSDSGKDEKGQERQLFIETPVTTAVVNCAVPGTLAL